MLGGLKLCPHVSVTHPSMASAMSLSKSGCGERMSIDVIIRHHIANSQFRCAN